jgi:5'-deoxynucleotidase YfbR-like HD superfamily hydrolase
MSKLTEQIKFVYNGGRPQRFHTHDTLLRQNVAEHSFYVTALATILYNDELPLLDFATLIRACLFHDVAEHVVGDLPSPTKRQSDVLKKTIDEFEYQALSRQNLYIPLPSVLKRKLKICDNLDGLMFCVREKAMGNRRMRVVFYNYYKYLVEQRLEGKEMEVFEYINNMWESANDQ